MLRVACRVSRAACCVLIDCRVQGLAAYWGFNEGEGRKVRDASPHHNDGIIHGSPRWVPTVTKSLFEETLVETM